MVHKEELPWITFLFLGAIFFIIQHELLFSIYEGVGDLEQAVEIETAVREGQLKRHLAFSMLGLFGAVSLFRRGQNGLRVNRTLGSFVLFFIFWATLSVFWADDAALTLRRVTVLGMLGVCALALGKHFSLHDIILWLFFTTATYLLLGIICEIALGTFRPLTSDYRFAGTLHPNHQGINCSLLLLTGLAMAKTAKRGNALFTIGALTGMVFLVLTGSRTAFAASLAATLFYWSLVLSRTQKVALLFAGGIGLCFLGLLFGEASVSALKKGLLLGRSESDLLDFTGRLPMWLEALNLEKSRLFHGYGYASFFTPSRIEEISASQGWGIGELHSTYLDIFLGLGMVGLIAFVAILALGVQASIEHFKRLSDSGYALFAALFVYFSLHGILETALVLHGLLTFVLLVLLIHLGCTVSQEDHESMRRESAYGCWQNVSLRGGKRCTKT